MTEENKSGGKGKLIAIVVLLLLLLAMTVYLFTQLNSANSKVEATKTTLDSTKASLQAANTSIDTLTTELADQLRQIQELGGDTAELNKQLVQLKRDLRSARGARAGDLKKIAMLTEQIQDYLEDLKRKDEEISTLKQERESIFQDNQKLRSNIATRDDSLAKLSVVQKELDEKVRLAQILRVEKAEVTAIDRKGKERKEDRYRNSRVDKIKVAFSFADNKVAKVETKDVYLRVLEPDGATLSDPGLGGGTMRTKDGKDIPYTFKQGILFDNSKTTNAFVWGKGSEYKSGLHSVEIWCEGHVVGTTSFTIR